MRQGFAVVKNPFSGKLSRVSLDRDGVGAIVFWSKDYHNFLPILEKVEPIYEGRLVFHFTITGFSKKVQEVLEPCVPYYRDVIEEAKLLAGRYGSDKVFWRFDPIVFSNLTPPKERLDAFSVLAEELRGVTKLCYISFIDLYGKVKRRLELVSNKYGIDFVKPDIDDQIDFVLRLKDIAFRSDIKIVTCCEDAVGKGANIPSGHCVDAFLLQKLFPKVPFTNALRPTRKECGCFESRDIGTYNTCRHGCMYCYANR